MPSRAALQFQFFDFRLKLVEPPEKLRFILTRRRGSPEPLHIRCQRRPSNRSEQRSHRHWPYLHIH